MVADRRHHSTGRGRDAEAFGRIAVIYEKEVTRGRKITQSLAIGGRRVRKGSVLQVKRRPDGSWLLGAAEVGLCERSNNYHKSVEWFGTAKIYR